MIAFLASLFNITLRKFDADKFLPTFVVPDNDVSKSFDPR